MHAFPRQPLHKRGSGVMRIRDLFWWLCNRHVVLCNITFHAVRNQQIMNIIIGRTRTYRTIGL